ncbi:pentatricopeptide repeat-containing protein At4g02750 [Nicotiana sylvestris]|uniref:Pentatricopeptide repeat-containing protein At4g02750 n=1 Tax=Nicotiana sylvestris TaxID=4096 RepID=A0A1U7VRT1_NICSY|nr:PREDICTED: pentatricopeptide repeat-containing protein At4g02750 [Nicotiana sylvestris]XP_009769079.1 PREDICTED: pentatricopeptide repeat-containing protein At4g02750 [Nicotiana sylvestris]
MVRDFKMRFRRLYSICSRSLKNEPATHLRAELPHRKSPKISGGEPPAKAKKVSSSDIVQWNRTITQHMRQGECDSALRLFDSMPAKSCVSWNAMISGYLSNGRLDLAQQLFDEMPQRDLVSWNIMLSGYIKSKNFGSAKILFDQMPVKDVVSWNALLSGYAQNGYIADAKRIFDMMPVKNEISWNGLLATYVQNGRIEEARKLFESKDYWPLVSWNCLLGGYLKKQLLAEARVLFDRMPVKDQVSWNTIISCYAQNDNLEEARKLFDESPIKDVFTWTSLLSGYVQNGMVDEARRIFHEMPEKNEISWNAMIAGYVQSKRMDLAREFFEAMPCKNVSSWNTMITGYAQNGDIVSARSLFHCMPCRDCISWAAIIAGYAQSGNSEEALRMFVEMKRNGGRINRSAFTCALSTCADIAAFELGKQIHGLLVKAGYHTGCYVGNALLAMYCKCGSIDEPYDVFEEIEEKDAVSWNTMIVGYARHGFGKQALQLFKSMKEAGFKPDDVTMVGVLSACGHTGLIDKGMEYFYSMGRDYGITANPKHYTCMIDLLGRAGRLNDAQNLMKDMPCEPDAATWGALLGASRIHGNTELGEKAAEMIFSLEPLNAGMYVLLSNLYAASGRWRDVSKMRLKMRDIGVRKMPGYSWVELQNQIHLFSVGDTMHPDNKKIYAFLEELELLMKQEGYVSATKLVLHDVDEEEKAHMLKYHSEKLAVAFAILNVPSGRPIRVMKNLRVCGDCHTAIKIISKIVGRLIIIRDNNRFHHFSGGVCTCGDYW